MPTIAVKASVLDGRAEVVAYTRDSSKFFLRVRVPEKAGYKSRRIDGERALVVDKVFPGCAVARAGLIKGDKITMINGRSFSLCKNQGDLKFASELSKEKAARITFERDGTSYTKNIKPTSCKFPAYRIKFNRNTGEVIFLY